MQDNGNYEAPLIEEAAANQDELVGQMFSDSESHLVFPSSNDPKDDSTRVARTAGTPGDDATSSPARTKGDSSRCGFQQQTSVSGRVL